MSGFDIESLLEFHPARSWCMNCRALWEDWSWWPPEKRDYDAFILSEDRKFLTCKVCAVNYVETEDRPIYFIGKFLEEHIGLPLSNIDNLVEHAKRLASISKEIRRQAVDFPPLRALFLALVEARSFVHFISWGITPLMIGALKVAAQTVPVRGIVSGKIGENIICEVNDFSDEAPALDIEFCESSSYRTIDIPHQKLVVIDGLLAFKGSANLTQMAWRSAEKSMDIIEVVSNISEIIRLHNQFFSPVWGKMNEYRKQKMRSQASPRSQSILERDHERLVSKFPSLANKNVISIV